MSVVMGNETVRLLFVSWDVSPRAAVTATLSEMGQSWVVDGVKDSAEALIRLGVDKYSVVVLDDTLDDADIYELCGREDLPPIIYLTSPADEDVAATALQLGAVNVLLKDETNRYLRILLPLVQRVIKQQRAITEHRTVAPAKLKTNGHLSAPLPKTKPLSAKQSSTPPPSIRDYFLSNMGYELRTPLLSILQEVKSMVLRGKSSISAETQQSLYTIGNSSQQLLNLVEQLLDMSQVDSGGLPLVFQDVDVHDACHAAVRDVSRSARQKRINISLALDSDVNHVYADPQRLRQILLIILTSAIKFVPARGRVGLEIAGLVDKRQIELKVWHTGTEISAESINLLFDTTITPKDQKLNSYGSVGLSLVLAYRLAKLMKGTLRVQNRAQGGNQIIFTLPWDEQPVINIESPKPAMPFETPLPKIASPSKMETTAPMLMPQITETTEVKAPVMVKVAPVKVAPPVTPLPEPVKIATPEPQTEPLILIIDGDRLGSTTIQDYLIAKNFRVKIAHTPTVGLEMAEQFAPSLIIMDNFQHEMLGLTLVNKLRAHPSTRAAPIFIQTAFIKRGDQEKCLAAGANLFLQKPTSLREILKQINIYLQAEKGIHGTK